MIIKSASVQHCLASGYIPIGDSVQCYEKKFQDLTSIYADISAIQAIKNEVAYTVYSYSVGDPKLMGNLNWGMTIIYPLTVNGECNMTRGHFHNNRDYSEIYFCISGEGLLLLMNEQGETWAEKLEKGSLHYIDGHLAHRLINTGNSDLMVGACWNTQAGYDYDSLKILPFGYRVYKTGEQIMFKEVSQ